MVRRPGFFAFGPRLMAETVMLIYRIIPRATHSPGARPITEQAVEYPVFPRIREISDAMGARLRITVEAHPTGAMVLLERPDQRRQERVRLDHYAAEVLWGYIMSARLALPGDLPDERIEGTFQTRFCLRHDPAVALVITQPCMERPFEISATFWDRLYAELCVVNAHARELSRRVEAYVQ